MKKGVDASTPQMWHPGVGVLKKNKKKKKKGGTGYLEKGKGSPLTRGHVKPVTGGEDTGGGKLLRGKS